MHDLVLSMPFNCHDRGLPKCSLLYQRGLLYQCCHWQPVCGSAAVGSLPIHYGTYCKIHMVFVVKSIWYIWCHKTTWISKLWFQTCMRQRA